MKLSLLILLQAVLITACSSKTSTAPIESTQIVTYSEIKQLDSAATVLRVIYDQSLNRASVRAPNVLSCEIAGDDAIAMLMPLKARMDEILGIEVKTYVANPKAYALKNDFSVCEKSCHCGIYSSILEAAETKPSDLKWHRVQLKVLQEKATKQSDDQSLSCASKQNWFCQSSLHKDLMKEIQ